MSSKTPNQLFPAFPPEVRNMIYAATLCPEENPPTSMNLPFKQKVYTTSHTTVNLVPTHHGLPSMMELQKQNFLEAHEYLSYILLKPAVSLRISVHFKGNPQTFNQDHWDQKHIAHLTSLVKKYPWLANVKDFDVHILYEPSVFYEGKRTRGDAGNISSRMLKVLTETLREAGRGIVVGGTLKASLHLEDYAVYENHNSSRRMMLSDFLDAERTAAVLKTPSSSSVTSSRSPYSSSSLSASARADKTPFFHTQTRIIRIAPREIYPDPQQNLPKGFQHIRRDPVSKPLIMHRADGTTEWTPWTRGDLVHQRTTHHAGNRNAVLDRHGSEEPDFKAKWRLSRVMYMSLASDCY